ncbi:hypothetical protein [Neobacillus sp. Marseille-QA0830]
MNATNVARLTQEEFKIQSTGPNLKKQDLKKLLNSITDGTPNYSKGDYVNLNLKNDLQNTEDVIKMELNNPDYDVIVYFYTIPVSKSLYKLHIQVLKNGKLLSETYTYTDLK